MSIIEHLNANICNMILYNIMQKNWETGEISADMNNERNVLGWDEAGWGTRVNSVWGRLSLRCLRTFRWRFQWSCRSVGLEFTKQMMAGGADSTGDYWSECNENKWGPSRRASGEEQEHTHCCTCVSVRMCTHPEWQRKRGENVFS